MEGSFVTRESAYVPDWKSGTGRELLRYDQGNGCVRTAYGQGYYASGCQAIPGPGESPVSGWKAWFLPDLRGSALFASAEKGEVLRYAARTPWGSLEIPLWDPNTGGLEEAMRFTTYEACPVTGKQDARARLYDPEQGGMPEWGCKFIPAVCTPHLTAYFPQLRSA